jgi:hypothetical protein
MLQNHKKQTVSRRRRKRFSRPPRHAKKMPRPLTKLSAKPEHQNSFHRTSKRKKRKETSTLSLPPASTPELQTQTKAKIRTNAHLQQRKRRIKGERAGER